MDHPTTLTTSSHPPPPTIAISSLIATAAAGARYPYPHDGGATGKGILIGMLSALGSAVFVLLLFTLVYFLRHTTRGRILLNQMGRPGQYDDEQAFLREEVEALETMEEMQRTEYLRAKAFIQANPPETAQTDISLSQFLAIQEKGVSAWEFEPELEIANCFVEGRTEIEFFDAECSVQSNLPIPKQNEVYYWEAKIYDKPDTSLISIGLTTKPYPLFRLPGFHKSSIAYTSYGPRRYNQPFSPTSYGPPYVQGDVVGVGYRPRTGAVFFTRNGKKLDDVAHGLKTQNFFPTVGATGPCVVHVNFGQSGFVFIEANVKKWGLAPMTGSLAPPPPYGSEQGSILLDGGREAQASQHNAAGDAAGPTVYPTGHGRSRSRFGPLTTGPMMSPGPVRSPTDISLAQLVHMPSREDLGEGTSRSAGGTVAAAANTTTTDCPAVGLGLEALSQRTPGEQYAQYGGVPPPEYESPRQSPTLGQEELRVDGQRNDGHSSQRPQVPSYDDAVSGNVGLEARRRRDEHESQAVRLDSSSSHRSSNTSSNGSSHSHRNSDHDDYNDSNGHDEHAERR